MELIVAEDQKILLIEDGDEVFIKEGIVFTFVPRNTDELQAILGFAKEHLKTFDDQEMLARTYQKVHTGRKYE